MIFLKTTNLNFSWKKILPSFISNLNLKKMQIYVNLKVEFGAVLKLPALKIKHKDNYLWSKHYVLYMKFIFQTLKIYFADFLKTMLIINHLTFKITLYFVNI